jgi:hypothetical protein
MSFYENLSKVAIVSHHADWYTQTGATAAPVLERLRREVYHCPAADSAPARL